MADWAPVTQDTDILTEYVRHALSRTICADLTDNGVIPIITMAKDVEDSVLDSIQHREQGSYLAIDPAKAQKILDAIGETTNAFQGGQIPTLLVAPQIRPHVRSLTERYYPALTIISHNEIAPNMKVKSLGTVTINAS